MFNQEAEALLTLVALSTFAVDGYRSTDLSPFEDAATILNAHALSDPRVTDINLVAWIAFNRLVLRDKMKLGPVGFRRWFGLLTDSLDAFPEADFVVRHVKIVTQWETLRRSRTAEERVAA